MAKIHFTKKYDTVLKILSSQSLKLYYCKEDFYLGNTKVSRAAHPMVCFSEYDLDTLHKQTITYGKYGIVFKEKWIRKNKIHPVLYIDKNSTVAKALADLLKARRNKEVRSLSVNVKYPIMVIKCFTKNEIGYNSSNNVHDFNFKQENEWRFVPTKSFIGENLISQNRSTYLKNPNFYDKKLEKSPLEFTLGDIEMIYVANVKEKENIIKNLKIDKTKISISKWKYKM